MSAFVLDASGLIAMLKQERGGQKVAGSIAFARIGVVNYAEVMSHFIRAGMPGREVDAMLDPLPMQIVDADKSLGQMAGRLRAITAAAGLSLGDRFCLALARREGLPAWTADTAWKTIAESARADVVLLR